MPGRCLHSCPFSPTRNGVEYLLRSSGKIRESPAEKTSNDILIARYFGLKLRIFTNLKDGRTHIA